MAEGYEPVRGGCQCGGIRYEVTGVPQQLVVCHCADCQRQSGSAFGMTLVVKEEDFRLTHGEPKSFTSTSDAGRAKFGAFAPSAARGFTTSPSIARARCLLSPGTLDDTSMLKPGIHIWTGSKQPWTVRHQNIRDD